jgi:hypothetical protein
VKLPIGKKHNVRGVILEAGGLQILGNIFMVATLLKNMFTVILISNNEEITY